MTTIVKFCLSYDLLNAIFLPSKIVYFNDNLHCCNGRRHDGTCSGQKCNVMCGHNTDMTLSTEEQKMTLIALLQRYLISCVKTPDDLKYIPYIHLHVLTSYFHR